MPTLSYKKLIKESYLIFFIGVSLLVTTLILRYLCIPLFTSTTHTRKELFYYNSKISSESGFAKLQQDIQRKIDILEQRKSSALHTMLSPDLSSYLEYLISIARRFDITFSSMQPQRETTTQDGTTLSPVLFTMKTSFHDFGRFIAAIEKQPHLYHIDRLSITSQSPQSCMVRLLLTCRISAAGVSDE